VAHARPDRAAQISSTGDLPPNRGVQHRTTSSHPAGYAHPIVVHDAGFGPTSGLNVGVRLSRVPRGELRYATPFRCVSVFDRSCAGDGRPATRTMGWLSRSASQSDMARVMSPRATPKSSCSAVVQSTNRSGVFGRWKASIPNHAPATPESVNRSLRHSPPVLRLALINEYRKSLHEIDPHLPSEVYEVDRDPVLDQQIIRPSFPPVEVTDRH